VLAESLSARQAVLSLPPVSFSLVRERKINGAVDHHDERDRGGQRKATRAKIGLAIGSGAAAVVALIIVAIVASWSADAWEAAATWVTAGIAGPGADGLLGGARRLCVERLSPELRRYRSATTRLRPCALAA
jgi:hypothetical protein